MQSTWSYIEITPKWQLSQRIATLTCELDALRSSNTRLCEQGASLDEQQVREISLIKEQASRDMQLLLEANEAAVREKDWFGSLYSKSRDAERLTFKEKEALGLELVEVKQCRDALYIELDTVIISSFPIACPRCVCVPASLDLPALLEMSC